MKPGIEFIGFLGLSVAAHLALWQGAADGVPGSAGDGGAASVTLSGGTPALQALVAQWDSAPETAPVPAMTPPDAADPAPALAMPPAADIPMAHPAAPLPPAVLPALPEIDSTAPPAPRPPAKPEPEKAQQEIPRKQAAPAPPSAPRQTAAGHGGNAIAGQSGDSGATARAEAKHASLMSRWGGAIRTRVERRKRYPGGAAGDGKTRLWLEVATSGQLKGVGIVRPSGNPAFDDAALGAVRSAALPRAPKGIEAGIYRFTLSVSFTR